MRHLLSTLAVAAVLGTVGFGAESAQAGCITGAIVGGLAGHAVGHGKIGAAAGCAVGHHNAKKKEQAGAPATK